MNTHGAFIHKTHAEREFPAALLVVWAYQRSKEFLGGCFFRLSGVFLCFWGVFLRFWGVFLCFLGVFFCFSRVSAFKKWGVNL